MGMMSVEHVNVLREEVLHCGQPEVAVQRLEFLDVVFSQLEVPALVVLPQPFQRLRLRNHPYAARQQKLQRYLRRRLAVLLGCINIAVPISRMASSLRILISSTKPGLPRGMQAITCTPFFWQMSTTPLCWRQGWYSIWFTIGLILQQLNRSSRLCPLKLLTPKCRVQPFLTHSSISFHTSQICRWVQRPSPSCPRAGKCRQYRSTYFRFRRASAALSYVTGFLSTWLNVLVAMNSSSLLQRPSLTHTSIACPSTLQFWQQMAVSMWRQPACRAALSTSRVCCLQLSLQVPSPTMGRSCLSGRVSKGGPRLFLGSSSIGYIQFRRASALDIQQRMVKKNKQLLINIIYQRYQDDFEENYTVERDSVGKGIDYELIVKYRNSFIESYQIRTEVRMSYISSDEEIHELSENFLLTYTQLERDYEGSLVILLRAEIDCVTSRIEELERKLDYIITELEELKRQRTVVAEQREEMKKHPSQPELAKTPSNFTNDTSGVIDVGILFSEPLVQRINDKEVSNTAEPVKFREQIDRLNKSLRKTARGEITIKCLIASMEKLQFLLKYKEVKILHIICHGLVEFDKVKQIEEGVLCFEKFHEIGAMDKIYGREISEMLKKMSERDRPKLVFVNACHSELIGDAFLNSGIEYVVVIQSSETIEDLAAQLFAESFYNNLFNGMGVQKSFTNAKDSLDRQNRPVNSNICCCHHRLDMHDSGCLWKKLLESMEKETAHDLYHVPTCKCSKSHLSFHEIGCAWAIQTLFNINKEFRVHNELTNTDRPLTADELAKDYQSLQICCCTTRTRSIPHDESEKFKFKHLPGVDPNKPLFQNTLQEQNSEVSDTTPIELKRDFSSFQKLFGRNEDVYELIKEILKPHKVLVVRGSVGSGRTGVVSKAATYLIERGKYKDDYIYLDLSNCSKNIDFEFCFMRKVRSLKVNEYNEALTKLANRDMLLVLDNADEYAQTAPKEFDNEVSYLIDRLGNSKLIIIVNEKTVLPLKTIGSISTKIIGPLKVFAAASMFIIYTKDYIEINNMETDQKEIRRLFASEKVRNPKTILDMVHFIKSQYSPTNKMPIAVLGQYIQNILENRTTNDKFLEDNLNNLKRHPDVYQLLLFIAQFEGGLTELDFSIMSNQREVPEELMLVKTHSAPVLRRTQSEIFLPSNWRNLVTELLSENFESKIQLTKEGFMKEGEYYYCVIEQKAEGFKSIKVKKYILDYLRKFDKSFETDLKFKALAYLSTFSSILVKLFKDKYYYHEQLAEYSTVSRCGFFQYEKSVEFAQFFDESEYFPDAIHDLTRSISRGREIDSEINDIFQDNPIVMQRHPAESVLQHQENFLQMYGNDFSEYYQQLPSEKRKLFKYYYHSILLNIPTLVKLAIEKSNSSFLKYCIDESIKKVNQLEAGKIGRSQNICTIKLLFMQVVHEISVRGKSEQLVSSYKNYFESIRLKMVWEKNSEISEIEQLDYFFLKAYIKYENLRQVNRMELEEYNKIVRLYTQARTTVETELSKRTGAKLISAKFSLLLAEIIIRLMDKEEYKNTFDVSKRLIETEEAQRTFKQNRLYKLEADALICQAKLSLMGLKKKSVDDINEYFEIRNRFIGPCRKLVRTEELRLNARDYEKELNDLEDRLKARIGKITKNYMVFMKANPLVSKSVQEEEKLQVVPFSMIKKKQMFRKAIESVLYTSSETAVRDILPRPQKEISVKFEILSQRNLNTILEQGCSVLVLKVNVLELEDSGELVMQFENETVPVQQKVPVRTFLERVDFKRLNVLILSGDRVQLLTERIVATHSEYPLIVTVQHQPRKLTQQTGDTFDIGFDEYSLRTLQRICSNFFICKLVESLVYSPERVRGDSIIGLVASSKQVMVIYMMGFSKNTCSQDCVNQFVKISVEAAKNKQIELEFSNGHFHDVSAERSNLHNLSSQNSDSYVGREELTYNIIKELVSGRQRNQPSYINLYGAKGCGKSAFLQELGCLLLQRGHFRSGIYLMNGWEIEQTYRGNINDYLEKHKSEIFHITYLNEQKVDGSQMLLIIDDFHAIKDRSNYLDYFFNSIYSNRVSLLLTSNEELSGKSIPDFNNRLLLNLPIRRLTELESMQLSYMYIPLYDFEDFREEYKNIFQELKKKQGNQLQPRNVMDEFKLLLAKANKKGALEKYKSYKEYIVEGQIKQLHLQLDRKPPEPEVPHLPLGRYHEQDSTRKRYKEAHSARPKLLHPRFDLSK